MTHVAGEACHVQRGAGRRCPRCIEEEQEEKESEEERQGEEEEWLGG